MEYPFAREPGFTPPEEFARLREQCPVSGVRLRHGQDAHLLTRYADVRAVLRDHGRFSSDPSSPGFPQLRPVVDRKAAPGSFLVLDPPEHTRFRRMVTREFTVRRMTALEPAVDRIVTERLDAMLAEVEPDLVTSFALALPSDVICLLLGVPARDQEFFATRSRAHLDRSLSADKVAEALAELNAYLADLVRSRRADPRDDLVGRLLRDFPDLTDEEAVGVTVLLLVGGHETTANTIALSVLALQGDPWRELVANPALVDGAVEELLRYLSPVHNGVVRAVTGEATLSDHDLRPGDGVIASLYAANHDPEAFPDPGTLDVHRDARDHLAFGGGVHHCVGRLLARLELRAALTALVTRVPTLRTTATPAEAAFRFDAPIYGLRELRVTW
ncbi:cytochrome P450 [Actinosynnema sp. NPDC020468]|uniref:cytochrome P450 n=1 Tax=Actinosynnema sp. NPDC020468 TaxID=3154488 RepID=UPI00340914E2